LEIVREETFTEGHRLFVEPVDPDKTEDGRHREDGVTETLSDRPDLLLPSITGPACTISRTSLTYYTSPHSVFS
jgi:hypothetical protein